MIAIIDYGMGNTGSLENMINRVGGKALITDDTDVIGSAEKIILPGVGHFDNAIKLLHSKNLFKVINYKVIEQKVPILCICLGAQLITQKSEEGTLDGFGWVKGQVRKFNFPDEQVKLRIPHMGWNTVSIKKKSLLFDNMPEECAFYFVHSFYLICELAEDVLTKTNYGFDFVSSIEKQNIYATQFHPEKSHKFGMQLIRNFVEKVC